MSEPLRKCGTCEDRRWIGFLALGHGPPVAGVLEPCPDCNADGGAVQEPDDDEKETMGQATLFTDG